MAVLALRHFQVGFDSRLNRFKRGLLRQFQHGSLFSLLLHGLALGRLFLLLGSELGLSFLFMALLRRFASGRIFRLLVFFFCFGGFLFGQLCSSFTFFFLM